ncbi:MAG: alpha/beta hydrolase [Candidatus Hydrogenedentota bacterium]
MAFLPCAAGAAEEPDWPKPAKLLWEDAAPGAKGDSTADVPVLYPYPVREKDATGVAVIVTPGGGYGHLALDHEGAQIACWLNEHGIVAYVLRYRHAPAYQHPYPKMDVQRAIRTVRHMAKDSHGAIERIGVIGFSAGGHLTATAATQFDSGNPAAGDPVERESSRPDFVILGYPVITMTGRYTHKGSRRNLLGEAPADDMIVAMSAEKHVTENTPPAFLFSAGDDKVVPVENSLMFYQALVAAGVPAEMHLFKSGPHGFGLGKDDPALSAWPGLCIAWILGDS